MTSSHTGPAVGVLEVVDLVEHDVARGRRSAGDPA